MPVAIAILTIGSVFLYSALKGLSVLDVLKGETGEPLDPKGFPFKPGGGGTVDELLDSVRGSAGGGKVLELFYDPLGGPHKIGGHMDHVHVASKDKAFLMRMRALASTYGLKMISHCRPGATTASGNRSHHADCNAMDFSNSSGPTPEMMAFAKHVKEKYL